MSSSMKSKQTSDGNKDRVAPKEPQVSTVIGERMNAEQALKKMMDGNERYVAGELESKDVKGRRKASQQGQQPFATVVACSDSRVEPVYIFNTNIEEIFGIQTAGNVVDDIAIGSIEYAVAHLKTPVLMILGHSKCGAVTAAYDGHREGRITRIMEKIEPAIRDVERTDDKDADVVKCAAANVKAVIKEILDKSEIVRDAVDKGDTKIVGAMYHLEDGRVELIA